MEFAARVKVISKVECDASQVVRGKPLPLGVIESARHDGIGVISFGPDQGKSVSYGDWIVYERAGALSSQVPSLWRKHEFTSWGGYVRADLVNVILKIAQAYRIGRLVVPEEYAAIFDELRTLEDSPHF